MAVPAPTSSHRKGFTMSDAWTFSFVDLAGFTALTDAHGDEHAIATVRAFQEQVRACLAADDRLVKTIGDAVMLAFPNPVAALTALERVFTDDESASSVTLLPRAGAHHGRAIRDGDDFYGHAVNIAARVAAQAAGGQLLVTDGVAVAARDRGHLISHIGSVSLRNIAEPIDLYEIDLDQRVSDIAIDPVCSMRVPTRGDRVISLTWNEQTTWFCGLPCAARYAAAPEQFSRPPVGA